MAVRLGSTLNANSIKAGDDVYLECVIEANPSAGLVSWTHNVSEWNALRQLALGPLRAGWTAHHFRVSAAGFIIAPGSGGCI